MAGKVAAHGYVGEAVGGQDGGYVRALAPADLDEQPAAWGQSAKGSGRHHRDGLQTGLARHQSALGLEIAHFPGAFPVFGRAHVGWVGDDQGVAAFPGGQDGKKSPSKKDTRFSTPWRTAFCRATARAAGLASRARPRAWGKVTARVTARHPEPVPRSAKASGGVSEKSSLTRSMRPSVSGRGMRGIRGDGEVQAVELPAAEDQGYGFALAAPGHQRPHGIELVRSQGSDPWPGSSPGRSRPKAWASRSWAESLGESTPFPAR